MERAASRLRAQAERARLFFSEAEEGFPRANANAERIEQVLDKLLHHNAIKFHSRWKIRAACVTTRRWFAYKRVRYRRGYPEEDPPRIFESFYRVDKARTGGRNRKQAQARASPVPNILCKHITAASGSPSG